MSTMKVDRKIYDRQMLEAVVEFQSLVGWLLSRLRPARRL